MEEFCQDWVSDSIPLTVFYPYSEVPKDTDLDELIFCGVEWTQSER